MLGPLLFLIYLNDFYKCSKKLNPVMFTDDTNLFIPRINVDDLFYDMNCEINKISLWFIYETIHIIVSWFKANKLSLNLTKANILYFTQSQNKKDF